MGFAVGESRGLTPRHQDEGGLPAMEQGGAEGVEITERTYRGKAT